VSEVLVSEHDGTLAQVIPRLHPDRAVVLGEQTDDPAPTGNSLAPVGLERTPAQRVDLDREYRSGALTSPLAIVATITS